MTLHIPELLITVLFYLGAGTLTLLVLASAWYVTVWWLVSCMENRRVFCMARVWLTFEDLRLNAEEYSWSIFRELALHLAVYDPDKFRGLAQAVARRLEMLDKKPDTGYELPPEA
jgi:hypothetical protein